MRFGLLALVPVVALGAALGYELNADVQSHAFAAARSTAELIARAAVQPLLQPADLQGGLSHERMAQIDQSLAAAAVGDTTARIKIWDTAGTVVYSDNHALIGKTYGIDDDLQAALAGHPQANVTSGHDPENKDDNLSGPLVQVYVPLTFTGDTRPSGAFEIYLHYGPVQSSIDRESHQLYGILAVGLALFYASMFPIVFVAEGWRRRLTAASAEAQDERRRGDEAERLSELKSQFLAATSHELRTPLNSILGFAQLLKLHVHGTLTERQEHYVDNIETSGRHLLAVVNDVLDLSKIEAGKLELAIETVELKEAVAAAIAVVQPLADARRIPVTVHGDRGLEGAADEQRLTQVLVNLLSNSIKFTPQDGRIAVEIGTGAAGHLKIDVVDTGSGISVDDQPGIFDDFAQAQTGRKIEGTGLGLPISRRLMRLMSGNLELIESSQHGSRFRVTLPAAAADRSASRAS